jgi:hypothetical protein
MALLIDIANAVAAELNGSVIWPEGVTAVMNLKPEFELKDLKNLKVTVVPRALKLSSETRRDGGREVKVDIGVQRKTADPDILAELFQLVEDIAGLFERKRLSQYQHAVCVGIENDPIYDPEHLRQMRQFTSVITLTFKVL